MIKEPNFDDLANIRVLRKASPPKESRDAFIQRVHAQFPTVTVRAMQDYVSAVQASDYIYGLFTERKINYSVLRSLSAMQTDDATRDFVARAVVERGLSCPQLDKLKRFLRTGKCSVAEALGKVCGEIPEHPVKPSERGANPDSINDEIMKLGTQWRMKVQMAMDLIPATTLEGGTARAVIFKKAYELRHLVREQLAFIDSKVEQFLKEIETHAQARSASRKDTATNGGTYDHDPGDHGTHGGPEAGALGEAEPAVQDPAQDAGR